MSTSYTTSIPSKGQYGLNSAVSDDNLLLQDGENLLLENGEVLLLESGLAIQSANFSPETPGKAGYTKYTPTKSGFTTVTPSKTSFS